MVHYINDIITEIEKVIKDRSSPELPSIFDLWKSFAEEIDRLDPRDFVPAYRYKFTINRTKVRVWAHSSTISGSSHPMMLQVCGAISEALEHYGGEGSRAETRDFSFITDMELKNIIQRDYKELSLVLLPGGAWKSSVVLAGSILEAILTDVLTSDPTILSQARASGKAPAKGDITKGEWRLQSLIEVAEDMNRIPKESAKAIDQILRDYRNFVHPKKEIRAKHPCTEAQSLMAKGALDAVCNFLEPIIA